MLVVTTPTVEGAPVKQYIGMVSGEAISGVNMFKDFGANLSNMFGGRASQYEEEIGGASATAVNEMCAPSRWAPTPLSASTSTTSRPARTTGCSPPSRRAQRSFSDPRPRAVTRATDSPPGGGSDPVSAPSLAGLSFVAATSAN